MGEAIAITAGIITVLAVAVFFFGPQILEQIAWKLEEWEDILGSLEDEK